MAENEGGGYTRLGDAWSFYKSRTNLSALRDIIDQYRKGLLKITIPKEISDIIAKNPFNLNIKGIITDAGLWDMEPGITLRPEDIARDISTLLPQLPIAVRVKYLGLMTPKAKLGDVKAMLDDALFYISLKPKYLNLISDVAKNITSINSLSERVDELKKSFGALSGAAMSMDAVKTGLKGQPDSYWDSVMGGYMGRSITSTTRGFGDSFWRGSGVNGFVTTRLNEWAKTYKPDIPAVNIANFKDSILGYANTSMDLRGYTTAYREAINIGRIPSISQNSYLFSQLLSYSTTMSDRLNAILKKYRGVSSCLRASLTEPQGGLTGRIENIYTSVKKAWEDLVNFTGDITNLDSYQVDWTTKLVASEALTGKEKVGTFSGKGFFGSRGLISSGVKQMFDWVDALPGGSVLVMGEGKDIAEQIKKATGEMLTAMKKQLGDKLTEIRKSISDARPEIDFTRGTIIGRFSACVPTTTDAQGNILPEFADGKRPESALWKEDWRVKWRTETGTEPGI